MKAMELRFGLTNLRTNWFNWCTQHSHGRFMTTDNQIQQKRNKYLEFVTELDKKANTAISLMELLKKQEEKIETVKFIRRHRRYINLPKVKIESFARKFPKLFELYKDPRGVAWCGMTERAEKVMREEEILVRDNEDKAAEFVTRFLMMSVDNTLPLRKIARLRRDFGLPVGFRTEWVNKYPNLFKVLINPDDKEKYLKLVNWDPRWAVTELERRFSRFSYDYYRTPGLLNLAFPMKFPKMYMRSWRVQEFFEGFQRSFYLSPYYADNPSWAHRPRTKLEREKRDVAAIHELLSFTVEKKLSNLDVLSLFNDELKLSSKPLGLLLRHCGIFYVSEDSSVFLTEAYEGEELVVKHPLALWKEKVTEGFVYKKPRERKEKTESEVQALEDEKRSLGRGIYRVKPWKEQKSSSVQERCNGKALEEEKRSSVVESKPSRGSWTPGYVQGSDGGKDEALLYEEIMKQLSCCDIPKP